MGRHRTRSRSQAGFIGKTIGVDEKLVMIAVMHWIELATGFAWFIVLSAVGIGIGAVISGYLESYLPAFSVDAFGMRLEGRSAIFKIFMMAAGGLIFMVYTIRFLTTKVGLTTKRIILRTGLIFVKIKDLDLEEIKSEHIDHGILGRFLNYGKIHYDARFVGDFTLPVLADPYRLLRTVHEAKSLQPDTISSLNRQANTAPEAPHKPQSQKQAETEMEYVGDTDGYQVFRRPRLDQWPRVKFTNTRLLLRQTGKSADTQNGETL